MPGDKVSIFTTLSTHPAQLEVSLEAIPSSHSSRHCFRSGSQICDYTIKLEQRLGHQKEYAIIIFIIAILKASRSPCLYVFSTPICTLHLLRIDSNLSFPLY